MMSIRELKWAGGGIRAALGMACVLLSASGAMAAQKHKMDDTPANGAASASVANSGAGAKGGSPAMHSDTAVNAVAAPADKHVGKKKGGKHDPEPFVEPGRIRELIEEAYDFLGDDLHDYAGHRHNAEVSLAKVIGERKRQPRGDAAQLSSDQRLQHSIQVLHLAGDLLDKKSDKGGGWLHHVNFAIQQLEVALRVDTDEKLDRAQAGQPRIDKQGPVPKKKH
jgi:hypothetical protein